MRMTNIYDFSFKVNLYEDCYLILKLFENINKEAHLKYY